MKTIAQISEILRSILTQPTGGVVGLVDELLQVTLENGLQLDWRPDQFRFRARGGDWEELADFGLRKSVFRAILARVAALCNEQASIPLSPYEGRGDLTVSPSNTAVVHVNYVNDASNQRLEIAAANVLNGRN
jgi:hypothetical protein